MAWKPNIQQAALLDIWRTTVQKWSECLTSPLFEWTKGIKISNGQFGLHKRGKKWQTLCDVINECPLSCCCRSLSISWRSSCRASRSLTWTTSTSSFQTSSGSWSSSHTRNITHGNHFFSLSLLHMYSGLLRYVCSYGYWGPFLGFDKVNKANKSHCPLFGCSLIILNKKRTLLFSISLMTIRQYCFNGTIV